MANNSIYSIDNWGAGVVYSKNKIVKQNNLYYYCLTNHTSSSFATNLSAGYWGGIITDNAEVKPHFIWKPAYNYSIDNQPKVKTIQFGDSYKQIVRDGINNISPVLNLEFQCDLAECTAILHFLETRAGSESFVFFSPAPRNTILRYTCPQWTDTQIFYGNYKIVCKFERAIV